MKIDFKIIKSRFYVFYMLRNNVKSRIFTYIN